MLTPKKIQELMKTISYKHTKPSFGLYPPQKKIMDYITRQINKMLNNNSEPEINKVKNMTNLLEGFVRYLNDTNIILKLDVEKILTYIYYPEREEITLDNKDNLMIGKKAETVRLWHDAYFKANREHIINCLIECKNVLYNKITKAEFIQTQESDMPEQMEKSYKEMLASGPDHGLNP